MALSDLLDRFKDQKVLVVGDIIADKAVIGFPQRISREAPVLILEHQETEILPGCAGNTINNICDLGATVYAAGVVGDDSTGSALTNFFATKGVDSAGLIVEEDRITGAKTRIWAGGAGLVRQQLVRIDSGSRSDIAESTGKKLLAYVTSLIGELDAIVFSDYGYGTLPDEIVSKIINLAQKHGVLTTADSRHDLRKFTGVTITTPNKQESEEFTGIQLQTNFDAEKMGRSINQSVKSQAVLITRGADGMSVLEANGQATHIPAFNKTQVYDVTGAGDTVIATLALGLAAGASFVDAALCANIAASLVVRKIGTATVSPVELAAAISSFNYEEWVTQ